MSIARSILFVLSVASTPLSALASLDVDAAQHAGHAAWARDRFSALTPYLAPTRYLNYLVADAVHPAAVAYGPSLGRLRKLKTKGDPDNFFRQNVNILPQSGEAA
jgi:hypothetical protein